MIHVTCSSCGAKLRVPDENAGKRGKCPKCQNILVIKADEEEDAYRLLDEGAEPPPLPPPAQIPAPRVQAPARSAFAPAPMAAPAATQVQEIAPGEGVRCPSCLQMLPARTRICVQCGINLPSGRPVLISRGLDEDMLEERGSIILQAISWIIWVGIYPVYSEARGRHRPWATWAIAALTIAVSVWFWTEDRPHEPQMQTYKNLMLWPVHERLDVDYIYYFYIHTSYGDRQAFKSELDKTPDNATEEQSALMAYKELTPEQRSLGEFRWYQLFTHQLLHGGILHLVGNLLFLLIFGSRVNAVVGQIPMLVLYPLLGAIASWDALLTTNALPIPSIGASGAIMGMAGMYLVLYPLHRMYMAAWLRLGLIGRFRLFYKFFAIRGFWVVLGYIALDAVMVLVAAEDGVNHWAHIGGFVGGVVLAILLLMARVVHSGSDLISLALGRHAWPLLGTPYSRQHKTAQ